MNGLKAVSVLALLMTVCALTEGKAVKRDENLDNVVRALEGLVQKKKVFNTPPRHESDLTPEKVLRKLYRLEDEIFLQKMLEVQASYDYICLHLMHWLHQHNRAMEMAEADQPEETTGHNDTVRALLKRVLFRMQRGSAGDNSTTSDDSTASPESTGSPESHGSPESNGSDESTDSPESISDETEESIMMEEDRIEWIGYLTSCWMWELMVYGSAPDFPYWLWAIY